MGYQRHVSPASHRAKRPCTQCTGNGWVSRWKTSFPSGFDHRTVQSAASRHHDQQTVNLWVGRVTEIILRLKRDCKRAEIKFRLSAKRTSPFKSAEGVVSSVEYFQPRCAPSEVVMLDTPCFEVVWTVLATHCIRQFPLHLPRPCVTACHHISTGIYRLLEQEWFDG